MKTTKNMPTTRAQWARWYERRFNSLSVRKGVLPRQLRDAEHMALWYLFLVEAERQGDL